MQKTWVENDEATEAWNGPLFDRFVEHREIVTTGLGAHGEAVGVDVAERFIEAARAEAKEAGATNVRFVATDVQMTEFEDRFDFAFSRMGTMFFANPVAAPSQRPQRARPALTVPYSTRRRDAQRKRRAAPQHLRGLRPR